MPNGSDNRHFDCFLSHNSADKPWVIRLKDELRQKDLKVWLDQDEIRPGDLFVEALERGIEESKSVGSNAAANETTHNAVAHAGRTWRARA